MADYQALAAYFGVTLVVFIGGLLWYRFRSDIKKRYPLVHYYEKDEESRKAVHTESQKPTHTHA
ncbi:MAG: hypothetical protein WB716_04740 [Candidatus Acidiferrales bacterium]